MMCINIFYIFYCISSTVFVCRKFRTNKESDVVFAWRVVELWDSFLKTIGVAKSVRGFKYRLAVPCRRDPWCQTTQKHPRAVNSWVLGECSREIPTSGHPGERWTLCLRQNYHPCFGGYFPSLYGDIARHDGKPASLDQQDWPLSVVSRKREPSELFRLLSISLVQM